MDLQRLQFSRRPACDRCRDQKLRCCRSDDQPNDACRRCQRANLPCVTGARRRVGRPRASASASPSPSFLRSDLLRVTDVPPIASPTQVLEDISTTAPIGSEALILREDDVSYGLGSLDFLDFDFSSSNSSHSPTVNTPQHPDLATPSFLADKLQINHMSPQEICKPVSIADFELRRHSDLEGIQHDNTGIIRQPPGLIKSSSSNMLQKLAQLNVDASTQISSLKLATWSGSGALDSCGDALMKPELNPLAQILNITAQLGNILEEFMPLRAGAPNTPHGLIMPIALLCVSCYLQLLHIFEYTFCRVCELLRGLPDIDQFFATAPKFHLHLGLPPVKWRFYLGVMIQTIQHQLGNVEQLLRLPPDTSVIGRSVPESEFCENERISKIFQLAIEQSRGMPNRTTSVTVESIKSSIEYISSFAEEEFC